MNYVIYYRVSTTKQEISGHGLSAQRAVVERYLASLPDVVVLDEFTEIESGGNNNRLALHKALRRCKLSGAKLVVSKLDRLSRDHGFIADLQKRSVDFVCADMPEANTLTIALLAVLADHERKMISTRTREALSAAKDRGVVLGNPNLSKVRCTDTSAARIARSATALERNAALRETIDEIVNDGWVDWTYTSVAAELNTRGYSTARGGEFTAKTVSRIMKATSF